MARTSQRLSSAGVKHQRTVSATSNGASKKARTTNSGKDIDDEEISATSVASEQSDFEDAATSSEEDNDEDDYDSLDDRPAQKKKKSTPHKTSTHSPMTVQPGVWREGVSAGLGPGKQVIIKKPKARSAGNTPYEEHTLHPNTFLFLADLKQHNERQWLKMHDPDFRQSERDWHSFVEKLTERIVDIDETVPELPVKDIIYRIYRDVRFSPDPTPYKPYFSVAFSRTGRKGPYAKYYVQVSPVDSFVAGGLWHPDAAHLATMRRTIDRDSRGFKNVLLEDRMRKEYLKAAPKNDAKVVKAFIAENLENALKTKPKGYDSNHPDIDLLRLRNFVVIHRLTQDELTGEGGLDRVAGLLQCMEPFITYLNSVVMPDELPSEDQEHEADDDESEDEDEDGDVEDADEE